VVVLASGELDVGDAQALVVNCRSSPENSRVAFYETPGGEAAEQTLCIYSTYSPFPSFSWSPPLLLHSGYLSLRGVPWRKPVESVSAGLSPSTNRFLLPVKLCLSVSDSEEARTWLADLTFLARPTHEVCRISPYISPPLLFFYRSYF